MKVVKLVMNDRLPSSVFESYSMTETIIFGIKNCNCEHHQVLDLRKTS
jgi:hypothetical protein